MPKLNVLRLHFFETLQAASIKTNHFTTTRSMLASYEYFRKRNLAKVTEFTAEENTRYTKYLPTVYTKLGKDYGLCFNNQGMAPAEIFDAARIRSGCQFLIDDVGKFVPDGPEKDENIYEMLESFEQLKNLLAGNDTEYHEYPNEPVPEHEGVPKSHVWWKELEISYPYIRPYNN